MEVSSQLLQEQSLSFPCSLGGLSTRLPFWVKVMGPASNVPVMRLLQQDP